MFKQPAALSLPLPAALLPSMAIVRSAAHPAVPIFLKQQG